MEVLQTFSHWAVSLDFRRIYGVYLSPCLKLGLNNAYRAEL